MKKNKNVKEELPPVIMDMDDILKSLEAKVDALEKRIDELEAEMRAAVRSNYPYGNW